jgi:hypothetical protein
VEIQASGSQAKFAALKSLQMQLYLSASDVERSYWSNRVILQVAPSPLSIYKIYKSYLNTMALSTAFEFHDSFTFEAFMDDFNDRYGTHTGDSSALTEIIAEFNTFSKWHTLATIKYQLLLIGMYEKAMAMQMMGQPQQMMHTSFMEMESQSEPLEMKQQDPASMLFMQYYYLQYYQLWIKYSAVLAELQMTSVGVNVAMMKHQIQASKKQNPSIYKDLDHLEGEVLPQLMHHWASLSQMKYWLDYSTIMLDMYAPQMAQANAADRMENTFVNLAQADSATEQA